MTTPGRDLLDAVAEVAREEYAQLSSADVTGAAFAELDSAELQKLARTVSERSGGAQSSARSVRIRAARALPRPLSRRLALLAALAAAVFGAGLWLAAPSSEPLAQRQSSDESRRRLELPDGSTLALAEHTDARVVALDAREVRVRLLRGSVECEVVHDPKRRFVVEVGALEVVVKGTRFTVSSGVRASGASPDSEAEALEQLAVSVERGLVEVRQPPDRVLALLGAGQRWSSDGRPPPATAPIEVEAPSAPESPPQPEAVAPPAAALPAERGAAPRKERPSSADRLFEQADAARLLGRSQRAAAAFDELRRRYPTDARAGYAAFMLGRIRLDTLADADGAAEAFAFAIAHPAGGFFLEDAKARQVEALDRAGRRDECHAARARFLKEHPGALRSGSVAQLCGKR